MTAGDAMTRAAVTAAHRAARLRRATPGEYLGAAWERIAAEAARGLPQAAWVQAGVWAALSSDARRGPRWAVVSLDAIRHELEAGDYRAVRPAWVLRTKGPVGVRREAAERRTLARSLRTAAAVVEREAGRPVADPMAVVRRACREYGVLPNRAGFRTAVRAVLAAG